MYLNQPVFCMPTSIPFIVKISWGRGRVRKKIRWTIKIKEYVCVIYVLISINWHKVDNKKIKLHTLKF